MFFAFVEFDGTFGRRRASRGFTTAAARQAWMEAQAPMSDEEWSDFEAWEGSVEEWPGIHIVE